MGLVASVSNNQVTLKNDPGWTGGQFVYSAGGETNSYFLMVANGTKEGNYYTVTGNTTNTVTLDLNGDTLTGLAAGDRVMVVPYWTLSTLFPAGRGIHASPTPGNRQTEILIPDLAGTGINLSASKIYYYYSGTWRQVGAGSTNKNDEVLLPDAYCIVRHNVATNTLFTVSGALFQSKWIIPLACRTAGQQDNVVAIPRPVAQTLNESGLISSGAFRASPTPGNHLDELIAFDNTAVAKNKSASAIYYYWNGAWRQNGAGATDKGNDVVFTPGTGVVIRKGVGGTTALWSNPPNY
jgi:uncharacterized protein (TIGR02597 family)